MSSPVRQISRTVQRLFPGPVWVRTVIFAAAFLAAVLFLMPRLAPELPFQVISRTGGTPGLSVIRFANESWEGDPVSRGELLRTEIKRPGNAMLKGSHFSLEMNGAVFLPVTGDYMFILQSDDGAYVTIDGQPVISDPGYHPVRIIERRVHLEKGWRTLQIRYFNGTAAAGLRLQWQPPGRSMAVMGPEFIFHSQPNMGAFRVHRFLVGLYQPYVPVFLLLLAFAAWSIQWAAVRRVMKSMRAFLYPAGVTGTALGILLFLLFAAFYHLPHRQPLAHGFDVTVTQPDMVGVDYDALRGSMVRFNSVTHRAFRHNMHRLTFSGWLFIDAPGDYTFSLQADDKASLYIDGQKVLISSIHEQYRTPARSRYFLSPGFHNVKINYQNERPPAYIDLKWKPPGGSFFRPIPSRSVYMHLPMPEEREADNVFYLKQSMIRWTLLGLIVLICLGIARRFPRDQWSVNGRVALSVFTVLFLSFASFLKQHHDAGLRWFIARDAITKTVICLVILLVGSGALKPLGDRIRRYLKNTWLPGWLLGAAAVCAAIAGQVFLTGTEPPWIKTGTVMYFLAGLLLWTGGFKPATFPRKTKFAGTSALQRRLFFFCFLMILIFAMTVRFYRLHEMPPGLWWDEAQTGRVVQDILNGSFPPIYDLRINAGTAVSYLNAAWCLLVDTTGPWGLRSYTAFIGMLTVAASWWFFRQLFNAGWSLFGMALTAGSRWLFSINRTAMATIDETILLTFLVLTFYIKSIRSRRTVHFIITGLLLGLAMHLHTGARVLPVIIGLDIMVHLIKKPSRLWHRYGQQAALLIVCALIVFAPMAHHIIEHSEDYMKRSRETLLSTEYPGWYPVGPYLQNIQNYIRMYFHHGDWHPRHNYDRTPQLPSVLAVCAALGAFLSMGRFSRRREHRLMVLGFGLISLQGILTVHMDTANLNRVAENIPIVFAWAVYGAEFAGRGIRRLLGHRFGRPAVAVLAAAITAVAWFQAWNIYFHQYLHWKNLAEVYGFQPEITEMASLAQILIREEPDLQVWAMYTRGDPFQYIFPGDQRLHDLSIPSAPREKKSFPMAFIVPAHRTAEVAWVRRTFPDARETAIPYSLNETVTLLHLFRVDPAVHAAGGGIDS